MTRKPVTDTTAAARGSVHQAIGKLMGDDAAEAQGAATRRAAGDDTERQTRDPEEEGGKPRPARSR